MQQTDHQTADALQADLSWCLQAKPLLGKALPYQFPSSKLTQWRQLLSPALAELTLANQHKRLGFYFEELWRCLISAHPDWQMLIDNQSINQDGRTIGAVDFVLVNHKLMQIEHWELAVKFYLSVDQDSRLRSYIGPGVQDRLEDKVSKLLLKQIPLGRHSKIQTQLPQDYSFRQRALLYGYLFERQNQEDPNQPCSWCEVDQLKNLEGWRLMPKSAWLAPQARELAPLTEQNLQSLQRAVQVFKPSTGQRLFLCPKGWLEQAQAYAR